MNTQEEAEWIDWPHKLFSIEFTGVTSGQAGVIVILESGSRKFMTTDEFMAAYPPDD